MDFQTSKLLFMTSCVFLLLFVFHAVSRYFGAAGEPNHVDKNAIQNVLNEYNRHIFKSEEAPTLTELTLKYKQNKLKLKDDKIYTPDQDCDGMPWLRAVSCDICEYAVAGLKYLVRTKAAQSDIEAFARSFCVLGEIEDKKVCDSIVEEFKDELFGVALRLALTPKEACGYILGKDCGAPYNPKLMWNVTFPDVPKPPIVPPKLPKAGSPTLRVLHITDFHFDPEYTEGSNAECGEPMCCRQDDGPPAPGKTGAGKYGDYRNCDSSINVINSLFRHLHSIQDQFDYVMFTGDIPAHNVWNQSRSDQLTALQFYTNTLKKYLPDKKVYNAVGNHESAPVDSFPPPFITGKESESWLYNSLAESWLTWLPQETKPTITKAGFYSVSPFPGFRIISLNTNMCNYNNWWLLINNTDPAGMLQWFVDELQDAENKGDKSLINNTDPAGMLQWFVNELQDAETKGDKVHVVGHIMPGCNCCLKPFSWNYYKIVNRYENTIVEHFFGHSHANFYQMFYDDVTFKRPIGLVHIPGSITTYSFLNPGFRIYEIDGNYNGSSWRVQDYTNYYLNLTEANLSGKAVWQKEYSAKEEFGMKSLFPKDWNDLIYKSMTDDDLFEKLCIHWWKSAPNQCSTCTGDCRKSFLCGYKTGLNGGPDFCRDLYI